MICYVFFVYFFLAVLFFTFFGLCGDLFTFFWWVGDTRACLYFVVFLWKCAVWRFWRGDVFNASVLGGFGVGRCYVAVLAWRRIECVFTLWFWWGDMLCGGFLVKMCLCICLGLVWRPNGRVSLLETCVETHGLQ